MRSSAAILMDELIFLYIQETEQKQGHVLK